MTPPAFWTRPHVPTRADLIANYENRILFYLELKSEAMRDIVPGLIRRLEDEIVKLSKGD
jgi:hypothetical protein